jgi:hypothetical protein
MILTLMKTIWRRWKRVAHGIMRAQNWFLMALTYVIAVGPVAIVLRIKHRDMTDRGLGDPDAKSYWLEPELGEQDIVRAQRPW